MAKTGDMSAVMREMKLKHPEVRLREYAEGDKRRTYDGLLSDAFDLLADFEERLAKLEAGGNGQDG